MDIIQLTISQLTIEELEQLIEKCNERLKNLKQNDRKEMIQGIIEQRGYYITQEECEDIELPHIILPYLVKGRFYDKEDQSDVSFSYVLDDSKQEEWIHHMIYDIDNFISENVDLENMVGEPDYGDWDDPGSAIYRESLYCYYSPVTLDTLKSLIIYQEIGDESCGIMAIIDDQIWNIGNYKLGDMVYSNNDKPIFNIEDDTELEEFTGENSFYVTLDEEDVEAYAQECTLPEKVKSRLLNYLLRKNSN